MTADHPKIRLYVEEPLREGAMVTLSQDQVHYLSSVMRAKVGTKLALFNGKDGEWLASFLPESRKRGAAGLEKQLRVQSSPPDVWLVFAPIKHGRIDYMVEKAAELGASAMHPVMTARTIASRVNVERLQAHAKEAAEQCERLEVPPVEEAVKLTQFLASFPKDRLLLYGDESGQGTAPKELFANLPDTQKWAVLVGPEGGFTPEEFEALRAHSEAQAISLGPRVLRADTAGLAALTCVMAWCGDWQHKPRFEG